MDPINGINIRLTLTPPPSLFVSDDDGSLFWYSVIDVEVTLIPGRVVFYPKDNNDVWGPDSVLEDYWAVIGQEGQVWYDARALRSVVS